MVAQSKKLANAITNAKLVFEADKVCNACFELIDGKKRVSNDCICVGAVRCDSIIDQNVSLFWVCSTFVDVGARAVFALSRRLLLLD